MQQPQRTQLARPHLFYTRTAPLGPHTRPTPEKFLLFEPGKAHQSINTQELAVVLPFLHRFACSLTRNPEQAADLVQDTVERALRKVHLFDGANLRGWMTTICKRVFLNNIRSAKSRGTSIVLEDAPPERLSILPLQEVHVHFSDVIAGLERLTVMDRRVLTLFAVDGLQYNAIAEILAVPVGTVRSRLSRARAKLSALVM